MGRAANRHSREVNPDDRCNIFLGSPTRGQAFGQNVKRTHGGAGGALRQPARHIGSGADAARPYFDLAGGGAARRGGVRRNQRGRHRHRAHLRRPRRADRSFRRRHFVGRPRQCAAWRRLHRLQPDGPSPRRSRRRPRLRRRTRHHAQGAQRASARHRVVFPDRPGSGRIDRRHGGDARFRHQCGALRHDEGQRAVAGDRHRRGRVPAHGEPGRANPRPATI